VYAAVLRFAPERFRSRYAQDAVDLASVRLRETRGVTRRTVRAIRELADGVATVRAERRAVRVSAGPSSSKGVFMDALIQDIRQALRGVIRGPAAAAAAIFTYALGIGANVAIFSVAWPALFAPLPFPEEDRLTAIWLTYPGRDNIEQINPVSVGDYNDLRTARSFSGMAAYGHFLREVNVAADGQPQQLQLGHVTPSFFTLMGVRPTAGRVLGPSDAGGEQPSIVLSERTWRTRFGGNPALVGRTVRVDGDPMHIVGIVPSTAGLGTIDPGAWALMELPPGRERLRSYRLRVVARLAPGVSRPAANDELRAIMARAAVEFPDANRHLSARADDFREQLTGPVRTPMLVLLGGAALVLLVAGINLAGLQIARNLHRAHELGIRHALGASRLRLLSQLVAENLTLALAGGVVAVAFSMVTLRAVGQWAPANEWHTGQTASTGAVLLFTLALSLVTGVAVALLPSWRASSAPRPEAAYARGSTASRTAARGRIAIISAQVALSVVLLVVATLVGASLARVLRVDPGFTLAAGLVADLSLPEGRYDSADARTRFFDTLVERAEALPGVTRACVINQVPLDTASGSMTWIAEGATEMISSSPKSASPGCYAVLGVPLLRGRLPASREREPVVAISQSMVRRLWPDGADPIGRRVHMGLTSGQLFTVVGIVGDIRNNSLERRPGYQVWMPHSSGYFTARRLAVRALVPPATLAPALRDILGELDPELALANIRTMGDIVRAATAPRRFTLLLLGGFAVIALVLSAVGIYGVLAHLVGQRAREIGIRRALGAGTSHITRVIAGSTGLAILIGTGAGLLGAWGLSTVVASLLFEMSATDPRAYAGVAVLVGVAAALAAWPPARRATRLDPLRALRQE
jgi:predicted permease